MKTGLNCHKELGERLGKEDIVYRSAIKGINTEMNTDIDEAFVDEYVFETFIAEVIIQNLMQGMYVDVSDVINNFKNSHFKEIVLDYCKRYGIK